MPHPPNPSLLLQSDGYNSMSRASTNGEIFAPANNHTCFNSNGSPASPVINSDLAELQLQQTLRELTAEVEKVMMCV